jgi:hypothetical protein
MFSGNLARDCVRYLRARSGLKDTWTRSRRLTPFRRSTRRMQKLPIPVLAVPVLTVHVPVVPVFIAAMLLVTLGGCQKQEVQPVAAPTAPAALVGTPAMEATPAAPVAGVAAPAPELVVPPEDRMEPMSLDKARLPGGAEMPADPVSAKKKKTP